MRKFQVLNAIDSILHLVFHALPLSDSLFHAFTHSDSVSWLRDEAAKHSSSKCEYDYVPTLNSTDGLKIVYEIYNGKLNIKLKQ